MDGPYQPGKVPVLFIHGLWSSPDAWLKMANSLQADPFIRDRYQFWFAYYPTGASFMASAVRLRQALHDLREGIDPRHGDPALDQMVVVGHSLGGVLSKQMIQSSGRALESGLLTRPFDQVTMPPEMRSKLSQFLYFEPEPSVRRVLFICAAQGEQCGQPVHRPPGLGAGPSEGRPCEYARGDHRPERAGGLPARVPPPSPQQHRQPQLRQSDPESPLRTSDRLQRAVPLDRRDPVPGGPTGLWTDGVVSYESAHLDGAESEIMVRHNHFANETPEATEEVRRILRVHLREGTGE